MPLRTLAVVSVLIAGSAGPAGPTVSAGATPPVVELGLTSPLEKLDDVDSFSRELAERLVWTVRGRDVDVGTNGVRIRFTAVRIDRGRVAASYQSEVHETSGGLGNIAESLGLEAFMAFPDVCFSSEDPPAVIRALSGKARLDAEGLEVAIADAALSREFAGSFGLDGPLNIEWGRHVVVVLAASGEESTILVRPLILVLERR